MGRLNRGSSFFVTGLALALISLVMLTSCSKDSGDAAPEQDRTLVLPLSSFYTGNGDKWNDYILNDGADIFSASNTAAVGNESGYYTALIHAAELKVVSVTGKTTCTDLTASDGLNAFDWVCDESTSPVRFKSTGLAANKHLSDLINFTAGTWKPNQVTVLDNGATYARTASAAWWTNTVTVDNDGTDGSDLVAGEIRLVTTDPVTATYTINTNRVSLLVDPAISLSNPTASATVYLNTASFLWFEGHLDVSKNSSLIGLQTNSVTFSVVRNMRLSSSNNVNQTGMQISSSSALRISDVSSENVDTAIGVDGSYNVFSDLTLKNGVSGIVMTGASATNNRVSRLTLSNFSTSCVSISGSAKQNVFQDIYGGKCGSIGFMIANANRNIVSRATINNSSTGLSLSFGGDNIISQFTSTNNSTCIQLASSNNVIMASTTSHCQSYGIQMMNSGNTIDRVASTNHSGTGLQLDTISQATIVDFAATNNANRGIVSTSVSNSRYDGVLLVGNNSLSDCYINLGTNPGLDDDVTVADVSTDTIHNGLCTPQGSSTLSAATTAVDLASSFVGGIFVDDSANTSDINGESSYPADPKLFDFSNFESPFRAWSKSDGIVEATASQRLPWTSGNGGIRDWRVSSSDTAIANILPEPTNGDLTITHTWSDASTTTYLMRAIEILDDGVGNDNLLCETNEVCLYTPNIASHQGQGALIDGSVFTNGAISNVVLKKYSQGQF